MSINIVVGYDFSEPSKPALNAALHQAVLLPGSVLHVLMALEEKHTELFPDIEIDYHGAGRIQELLSETVQGRVRQFRPQGIQFYVHVRIGRPAEELLALAAEADADLLVVGTHGHSGVKRWLVGSVAEQVVREAHCPVVVARPKDYTLTYSDAPEPPCPTCVEMRRESHGARWWCDNHAKPYLPPHRYRYHQDIVEMMPDEQPLW
ncbi:universal stress protein [Haliangium sp.]|uniref:universal stress protein n=1 Tax=Haliangium sp. TaxID=2663208 RepID=UPI003D122024